MSLPAIGAAVVGQVVTWANVAKSICLKVADIANDGVPSLATDGVAVYPATDVFTGEKGHAYPNTPPRISTLQLLGTVTAGQTLVGTFTLWGYHPVIGWLEIPTNGGTTITPIALAETQADIITFTQQYESLGHYSRVALQLTAVGGTGATFEAWLTTALENS